MGHILPPKKALDPEKTAPADHQDQFWARLFKLMSLVNVSLKFQTLISEIRQYFLLKKCEKLLQCSAKASLIF